MGRYRQDYNRHHERSNVEGEVASALSASETFLSHARDEAYKIPEFNVKSSSFYHQYPTEVEINNDDGKPTGKATISYGFWGDLKGIDIDRDGDGKIDSKIHKRVNGDGVPDALHFDMNADGNIDATATLWWSGFPSRYLRDVAYYKGNDLLAKAKLSYNLIGLDTIMLDTNLDGKPDDSASVSRGWFSPMDKLAP